MKPLQIRILIGLFCLYLFPTSFAAACEPARTGDQLLERVQSEITKPSVTLLEIVKVQCLMDRSKFSRSEVPAALIEQIAIAFLKSRGLTEESLEGLLSWFVRYSDFSPSALPLATRVATHKLAPPPANMAAILMNSEPGIVPPALLTAVLFDPRSRTEDAFVKVINVVALRTNAHPDLGLKGLKALLRTSKLSRNAVDQLVLVVGGNVRVPGVEVLLEEALTSENASLETTGPAVVLAAARIRAEMRGWEAGERIVSNLIWRAGSMVYGAVIKAILLNPGWLSNEESLLQAAIQTVQLDEDAKADCLKLLLFHGRNFGSRDQLLGQLMDRTDLNLLDISGQMTEWFHELVDGPGIPPRLKIYFERMAHSRSLQNQNFSGMFPILAVLVAQLPIQNRAEIIEVLREGDTIKDADRQIVQKVLDRLDEYPIMGQKK